MDSFSGRYFSATSALAEEVQVYPTPAGLRIVGSTGERVWPYEELRLDEHSRATLRLERGDSPSPSVVVRDESILARIQEVAPAMTAAFGCRRGRSHRWVTSWASLLGAVAGIALIMLRGLPTVSDFVAIHLPTEWNDRIGAVVLSEVLPPGARLEDSLLVAETQRVLDRLIRESGHDDLEITLHLSSSDEVNAFALPGGNIVVPRGLLEDVRTPEELAGVLAHEIQHVRHRHPTQSITRQLSSGVLVGLLAGNSESLSATLQLAGHVGGMQYSREDEAEADRDGVHMLIAAGIDPRGLVDFLEGLEPGDGARGSVPSLLSTHPATEDRVRMLEEMIEALPSREFRPIETGVPWGAIGEPPAENALQEE